MTRKPSRNLLSAALIGLLGTTALGQAQADSSSFTGAAKDAWIAGKVEMAFTLNEHLNPFDIDTDVSSGTVMLSGMVDTDIEKDLAEEIAKGVDGVSMIENEITVGMADEKSMPGSDEQERRNFPSWFDDATTTAAVKSKLIANSNTKGLEIDVDTREDVVTLSGRVASQEQKELAGELARNTGDVKDVRNLIVVDNS